MSQPTPFGLSRLFTQLTGRKVEFCQTTAALDSRFKQVYGIYTVLPSQTSIIVKADIGLLGSFAGVLVGLPDSEVKERLKANPMEELLRDAIYEVLNIASAGVTTEGRAIFDKMVTDPTYIDHAAGKVFLKPDHRSYFNVTVQGYQGGRFSILAQMLPVTRANA
jgi:hypothetical protein